VVRRRRILPIVGAALLFAWCGWVSGFHRSSAAAEITWVVSLALVGLVSVLFWLGRRGATFGWNVGTATQPWPRAHRGGTRLALRGVALWLGVIVVASAWDALGIDTGRHEYHLTISALSAAFRPLNALLLLVWMLVGIGYAAARARTPVQVRRREASSDDRLTAEPPGGASLGAAGSGASGAHGLAPALLLPSNRPAGVVFWVGLLIVAVAVEVVARRSAGRIATAEEFVRFISTATLANIALIAVWAFAGYHLFAR
jgi:hypothetical protein